MAADAHIAPPATAADVAGAFDVLGVRADFPILSREVNGRPLVYLDNAASSQKPTAVIDRIRTYYEREHANVHRGVHRLSQDATDAFEAARETVRAFLGAERTDEIIFTRGTTDGINLVASSLGSHLSPGDEIVVTGMEHHSNLVPWQLLSRYGVRLRVGRVTDRGELDLDHFATLFGERTRLVAVVHTSNSLGTVNPIPSIVEMARARDVPVLVDGAQAVAHGSVDVRTLDVDFFALSGHKMFGPTGVGVLYGKKERLEALPPYQGGGEMIDVVSYESATYAPLPHRLEAGTPNMAGVLGLAAAIDYLGAVGTDRLAAYEQRLLAYATARLEAIPGLRIVGQADRKVSVVSFLVGETHPYDTGTILDQLGIAVRTGHHCTMPLMDAMDLPGTVRASFSFYNTAQEVDALCEAIERSREILGDA